MAVQIQNLSRYHSRQISTRPAYTAGSANDIDPESGLVEFMGE